MNDEAVTREERDLAIARLLSSLDDNDRGHALAMLTTWPGVTADGLREALGR